MSWKLPDRLSPRVFVLLLLGLATAAKALWAMNSLGTCDVMIFAGFANAMLKMGLASLYQRAAMFNHTPFTGWLVKEIYVASGHDALRFATMLRLACILADIALVLGLLRVRKLTGKPPWWALCLFAASPVSIMVSGFHGNIDPIMVMFLFLAAVAVLQDRPVLCGLMFAAACNIKIPPILVAPVFIFYWIGRGRRPAISFMGASGALMLAGASWALIHCPAAFLRNVFGYGSYWGSWGVTYWLSHTGVKDFEQFGFQGLSAAQNGVILALKLITLSGVLTLAWRRRKLGGIEFLTTLGAAFTWIFVFMPGAGAQYMVWFAPFLLLLSPGWWAALTAGAAIYMARFYHSTAGFHFPWFFAVPRGPDTPYWAPWTNLVWGTFIALLLCRGPSWFLIEKRAPAPLAQPPVAIEAV
jgi:hypothetical protein